MTLVSLQSRAAEKPCSHDHDGPHGAHGAHGAHEPCAKPEAERCSDCPSKQAKREDFSHLPEDAPAKVHRRFDRLARLVGDQGVARLARAHVMVIGCGGVGSFAAESLARSGVGRISLVDFDLVCVTNTNRQLHTMKGTVGRPKVEVMAERLRLVHPTARVDAVVRFYDKDTRDELLPPGEVPPDFVIDAIDNVTAKLDLLATCLRRGIPVITAMGASGRFDPTQVRVADLAHTVRDGLAKDVRKWLQRKHGVTLREDGTIGIPAIYSEEAMTPPARVAADEAGGFQCVCPHGANDVHSCDQRARIDGTASFVTGTFGLTAASYVVRALASPEAATRTLVTPRGVKRAKKRPRPLSKASE
jgi:tRNA A37 threonylcarbamoyladenosine dehydratase